jgi:hypothetical protein
MVLCRITSVGARKAAERKPKNTDKPCTKFVETMVDINDQSHSYNGGSHNEYRWSWTEL